MEIKKLIVAAIKKHFKYRAVQIIGGVVQFRMAAAEPWQVCGDLIDFSIRCDDLYYHVHYRASHIYAELIT